MPFGSHRGSLPSKRSSQPFVCLCLGAVCIIFCIDCFSILRHGPLALPQDVVYLPQVNIAPYFDPLRVPVPIERVTKRIGSLLQVELLVKNLSQTEVGERAMRIQL